MPEKTGNRFSAALFLALLAAAPVAAQSPAEAALERLYQDRGAALAAALARAAMPPPATAALPVVEEDASLSHDSSPAWQQALSPRLRGLLERILEAEGVPAELLAVGWVESRFDPQALSPKGARGLWQLMPETARRYGLEVSGKRDERTDLTRSTRAAARYLAELHRRFGDWELALAAYNAGEQRVEAALERAGSRELRELGRWLPRETRQYVPAVLAAMEGAPPNGETREPR